MPTLATKNSNHKLVVNGQRIPELKQIEELAAALEQAVAGKERRKPIGSAGNGKSKS